MAINDERDPTGPRMDIDDIVERDSSSSFIVMIVLAIALVLAGWYLYSLSKVATGTTPRAAVTQPTNVPALPRAS